MNKARIPMLLLAVLFTGACAMEATRQEDMVDVPLPPPQAPEIAAVNDGVIVPEVPPPPPPRPDPNELLSLQPDEVQGRMGLPDFVRRDGTAQILQFKNQACVLDIIFYEEGPEGFFIARHLEARSKDGGVFDVEECLISLLPNGVWPEADLGRHMP